MDEQKLKVILEAEIDDAIGYVETETVEQRTKAINYYNRYEYGNEVDGRSKIAQHGTKRLLQIALIRIGQGAFFAPFQMLCSGLHGLLDGGEWVKA